MKQVPFLILLLLFLTAACSPSSQAPPEQSDRAFFTPRNWQIPIVKEEEPTSAREEQRSAITPSTAEEQQTIKQSSDDPDEQMIGYASWYGPGFHGEQTANGEKYNQDELTAAHRLLPMNTWVRVTNLENNKTVIVRINDRGPYKKNRIIDVTRKAAEILDFKDQGTARVALNVVRYPKDYDPEQGLEPYKQTVVQIAAFSTQERADSFKLQLAQKYTKIPLFIETRKNLFYVLAGPYENKENAIAVGDALEAEGIENFVRSYRK